MEPWPQELERPDTSPDASNGIRHGPCSATSGVSEASHKRGHPIPVIGGLVSQPLTTSRVYACKSERARPSLPPGRGGLPLCANKELDFTHTPTTDR